jgi:hypothetical protein
MSCWQSRSLNKSVNWALSTLTCTADRFVRCPYGDTPAPDCGAVLAGAYICDPRARCKAAPWWRAVCMDWRGVALQAKYASRWKRARDASEHADAIAEDVGLMRFNA